ncbi:MAG: DNA polymerase III subunit delta' [Candidatus Nealsonbacteria bacterium CG_4_10_14_0_2_um_filter_38_17]|uniref:DNA polymerase III subunit delta n=2 Tax=Candidatus Nealsoniibacteriota TaxID=1817911 RepID=A0A2M7UXR1_9BACT|nr:MAG: DNA polymerase III subunit delta' [Candidatus Nealsonbacteria bacterium CG23_combo_of_CG06-09_8_20_14_all_38_19]PIZ88752.1 MAG: DNA polymerase III subunit delta' [Candidatus Nealsonbacteria bacterium CG_4_10_14_0_2_um_filter_38_17]
MIKISDLSMVIIGHQKQWQFLKKSADLGKLSHAYLFQGQEQLGKRTLALEFVKYLNCEKSEKRPCQTCRSCQDVQKGQYPDLVIIEPQGKEIQIAQIRELSWHLSLKPYSSSLKTVIIDNAHLMNQEAQSCFLKTLEEPKGNSLLVLITDYPEMLFSTILSRVQKIKFSSVSAEEIKSYLKEKGYLLKTAEEIVHFSFGRPGQAINFAVDPQRLESYKEKIKELLKISNSDFSLRFQYAKDLSENSAFVKDTLEIWLRFFRGMLINSISANPTIIKSFNNYSVSKMELPRPRRDGVSLRASSFSGSLPAQADTPDDGALGYSAAKIKKIIENLQKINYWISNTNVNARLALEILMLEF